MFFFKDDTETLTGDSVPRNYFDALPAEIKVSIFKQLSSEDLRRCAQVSKTWYFFANDELLWKTRLKDDFYFSDQAVQRLWERRLRARLSIHYKEIYKYCMQYQLNDYQLNAVQQLTSFNVTREHFCGRDWFNSKCHLQALTSLIKKDKLKTATAIDELDHMNENQALALSQLFSKGLKAVYFHQEQYLFFHEYQLECLCYLMLNRISGVFDVDTATAILSYINLQIVFNYPFDSPQSYFSNQTEIEHHVKSFLSQSSNNHHFDGKY